jgi:Tfp pilus assembly protein PilF
VALVVICLCGLFGLHLIRQGGQGDPVQQAQAGVNRNPNDPMAHYNLAIALADADRLDEAQAEYIQALGLGGEDVGFYQMAGEEMVARQHWTAAAMAYLRLADIMPKPLPVEITFRLHETLYQGASEENIFDLIPLERIVQVDPRIAAVVEARHVLYFGGPVRAQGLVELILQRSPEHAEAQLLQAEIHFHAGNVQAAQEQIDRLRAVPGLPYWINDFAQMMLDQMNP